MATLNTVRAILKDSRMREQAHIIQKEVGAMMVDVERLDKRVGNLSSHFDQTRRDVDEIRTSTNKILRRGETIESIGLEGPANPAQTLGANVPEEVAQRTLAEVVVVGLLLELRKDALGILVGPVR